MTILSNVNIASVNFAISCDSDITIPEVDPIYRPFLKGDNTGKKVKISVKISLEKMPDTNSFSRVFDCGSAWSLFCDKNHYYIVQYVMSWKEVFFTTKANYDFSNVTIYCGKKSVKKINGRLTVTNPIRYPLDQILMMHILSLKEGLSLHSAGVGINGRCFIFPGVSGAGKSTIAKLFMKHSNAGLLSDDRVVVRKLGNSFRAYGTPWPGEAGIAKNKSMPLSALFFLNQSSENSIHLLPPEKAFERLLPVSSIPWYDKGLINKCFDFCNDLVAGIPAYDLYFKPGPEVTEIIEDFLR